MFKRVLLLLAVMAALVVVPVVAYDNETEIYDEFYRFETYRSHDTHYKTIGESLKRLRVNKIENISSIQTVFYRPFGNAEIWVELVNSTKITGVEPVRLHYGDSSAQILAEGAVSYYRGETPLTSHVRLDLDTWYDDVIGDHHTGPRNLYIEFTNGTNLREIGTKGGTTYSDELACFGTAYTSIAGDYEVEYFTSFRHKLILEEDPNDSEKYCLNCIREFGKKHDSIITITDRYGNVTGSYHHSVSKYYPAGNKSQSPFLVTVESTESGESYTAYLGPGEFTFPPLVGEPCTIRVYDADSRLPLSGAWDYYVVIEGADSVSGSASGASKTIHLPATSIIQPHLLRVTKEGYVQVPEILAINVPAGGREIPVYLRSTTAAPEEGNVWLGFTCTDADTGSPVSSALVNLDGSAQYTGASGYVRFQVPMNSTHKWVASSSSHWPMGGTVTVETADLNVPVELVRKTSDLPRPPLPDLPNFPVIHPVLDPSVFRAQILDVPILGGLASPILDTMDAVAAGLDDIVHPILDFVTAPADSVVQALEGVGNQLTVSVTTYTNIAGVVLGSVGKLLAVFPDLVIGLVTYNLVLDLVYLLLRGGL